MTFANDDPRSLYELSLAQLWQLFPIMLCESNQEYSNWYATVVAELSDLLGAEISRVSHIGSTAVPGLVAKPIVDILLEVSPETDKQTVLDRILGAGWLLMNAGPASELRMAFNKGYTPQGFAERVLHLHIRSSGDWDELYFRDFLVAHPKTAEAYAELKRELAKRFKHDRDAYTAAKGDFIAEVVQQARMEFPGRYSN